MRLRSFAVANGTDNATLPTRQFTVNDVRLSSNTALLPYWQPGLFYLTFFSVLLDKPHLDSLSPGCKHCGKPLWQGHGVRSQPWS